MPVEDPVAVCWVYAGNARSGKQLACAVSISAPFLNVVPAWAGDADSRTAAARARGSRHRSFMLRSSASLWSRAIRRAPQGLRAQPAGFTSTRSPPWRCAARRRLPRRRGVGLVDLGPRLHAGPGADAVKPAQALGQ